MIPKKKLLVLIPFIPYPLNTGGNQGSFHMLNYVKEYFDVHIWFHINNENKTRPLLDEFSKVLNNQVKIHFTSNKIGRNFITARAIKRKTDNIFLKNDVQYLHNRKLWGEGASGFADLQALEDINNIIVREKIELVQVEFSMLIDVIYALPKAVKTIFVHHEIGFARKRTLMSQLEYLYTYDWYWYEKSKAEEITALNRYDVVITLSDVDKEKLKKEGVVTEKEHNT